MPRLTLSNDQLMIYDDFLPRDAFESLLVHANKDRYATVHRGAWQKAWRVDDGIPLHGTATYYRDDASLFREEEQPRYPTHGPLDAFFEAVNEVTGQAEKIVGRRGTAWTGITASPWVYPAGTALSLHRDHYQYSGSFTYYIHRQWSFHWGGQLLVLDPRTGCGAPDLDDSPQGWPFLLDDEENAHVSEPGLATCILPKPNRLVFIERNAYHLVTRVDPNAGNRPRVALAGFFIPPGAVLG